MSHPDPIAIIGMACRFPGGVDSPQALWQLLLEGRDAVSDIPPSRWNHDNFYHPHPSLPGRVAARRAGLLDNLEAFDAGFFGVSPREAALMDPQQRLMLEASFEALEDAGQPVEHLAGRPVGVFTGSCTKDYVTLQGMDTTDGSIVTGTAHCMLANRISYTYDLRGPSLTVDTACSSALLAIHLACRSLREGESVMALAGAVNVMVAPADFVLHGNGGMLSPDGQCRAFDRQGAGYVRSEGVGVLVLKRLSDAIRAGDRIHALILNSGINQDGRTVGVTVPSLESQAALLRQVYGDIGLGPSDVAYVEAHGTGTPVGDPIEATSIGSVLGRVDSPLPIGSVKTNLGHLEAASGVAGLIKAVLMLQHGVMPGNLHLTEAHPDIDFARLGIRVPVQAAPLPPGVVGVNSFGLGGTNAHVVLGAAPRPATVTAAPVQGPWLLPISARHPEVLVHRQEQFTTLLGNTDRWADVCHMAAVHSSHHGFRTAALLSNQVVPTMPTASPPAARGKMAFVFCGQGAIWWQTGRHLLQQEPIFRGVIETCDEHIRCLGGWSLLEELERDETASRLDRDTSVSQPALFAIQMGLVGLLAHWGIVPDAVVGHSAGAPAAACCAGVLSLVDALTLSFHRGRLMQEGAPRGRMLAVQLGAQELTSVVAGMENVVVAVFNGPQSTVLSGPAAPLDAYADTLERDGIFCRPLEVDLCFHHPGVEPIATALCEALGALEHRVGDRPMMSTVKARWLHPDDFKDQYWWQTVVEPVRFWQAIQAMLADDYRTFVEIGPHPVLGNAIRETAAGGQPVTVLPTLIRRRPERESLLESVGRLYEMGWNLRWETLSPPGNWLDLPRYPWAHRRYWTESASSHWFRHGPTRHPLLGRRGPDAVPTWTQELDTRNLPFLGHHRLHGEPLVSASTYLAAAAASGRELYPTAGLQLEDVHFTGTCFFADQGRTHLRTVVQEATGRGDIHSGSGRGPWQPHATFQVHRRGSGNGPRLDLLALRSRCPVRYSAEDYKSRFPTVFELEGSFSCLREVHAGQRECLAWLDAPPDLGLAFDPGQLDGCLQVLRVLHGSRHVYPIGVESLRLWAPHHGPVVVHARLRRSDDRHVVADLDVADQDGNVTLEIRGYCGRKTVAGESPFLATRWQSTTPMTASLSNPRQWIIFGQPDHDVVRGLLSKARAEGHTAILVQPGQHFQKRGPEHYETSPDTMTQVLADLGDAGAHVVYLWPLTMAVRDIDINLTGALRLVQAIQHRSWSITAVTERVWSIPEAPPSLLGLADRSVASPRRPHLGPGPVLPEHAGSGSVAGAVLWGWFRSCRVEHPNLQARLIDVSGPADVERLWADLQGGAESEIAYRNGTRLVARVERSALFDIRRGSSVVRPADTGYRLEIATPGELQSLQPVACDRPQLRAGEVRIQVHATSVNFADVMRVLDLLPGQEGAPLSLGSEAAGVVTEVGPGVHQVAVGQRVLAVCRHAFASFVTARVEYTLPLPDEVAFEAAAGLPVVVMTAIYGLQDLAHLRCGERVLIHSAAGGLGLAAIQVARQAGADIYATAGTEHKRSFLRSQGLTHVFDSRSLSWADEVLAATGDGVDVVLNSLAGNAIPAGMRVLREYGRFVEVGKRDVWNGADLGLRPLRRNLSFFAVDLAAAIDHRPELVADLLRRMRDGAFQPLPTRTFSFESAADAMRYMSKGEHIGKIVLRPGSGPVEMLLPSRPGPLAQPDATYLIVGGLRGAGFETAEWLAAQGARHLLLMSRSGQPDPQVAERMAALRASGVSLYPVAVDVTDRAALQHELERIPADRPLRGVVHSAMVIDDGLIQHQTRERLWNVLAPKVLGAWNLHELTSQRSTTANLDFFVMFSSMASVLGSPGQSSYAAGNAFLDALAWHRQQQGLPALAINWPALGGFGYLFEHPEIAAPVTRLTSDEFRYALEAAWRAQVPQVGVVPAGPSLARRLPRLPRFEALIQADGNPGDNGQRSPRQALQATRPEDRPAALVELLATQMGRILRTSPPTIERRTALSDLGMDSLMTLELRNWMAQTLGVTLPGGDGLRRSSLAEVAATLATLLDDGSVKVSREVADLSDQEVERLLSDMLEGVSPAAEGSRRA